MVKNKSSIKYDIVFSIGGKSWDEEAKDDTELASKLKQFYDQHIKNVEDEWHDCDALVFDREGKNITETQLVSDMIENIIGDD